MKRRGTPATLPAWWQGWPARTHVRRWIDDLVLSEDRFMERAARRDAQAAAGASGRKPKRKRMHGAAPPPSPDELATFYAAKVNSDEYLPNGMISTAMCAAMLERRLVTPERLRMRGVQ